MLMHHESRPRNPSPAPDRTWRMLLRNCYRMVTAAAIRCAKPERVAISAQVVNGTGPNWEDITENCCCASGSSITLGGSGMNNWANSLVISAHNLASVCKTICTHASDTPSGAAHHCVEGRTDPLSGYRRRHHNHVLAITHEFGGPLPDARDQSVG